MEKRQAQRIPAELALSQQSQEQLSSKVSWLRWIKVRDIMSSPVICIDSKSSVTSAQLLMQEHAIRRLPVVDEGRLVGIITLNDVRGALPSEATTLNRSELEYLTEQLKVERVMRREVATTTEETSLKDVARLMAQHKISGLPVVSASGIVVGMVTESDIFKVLVDLLELDEPTPALAAPV